MLVDTCVDQGGTLECNSEDGPEIGSVVADQMVVHLGLGFALWEHLLLSLNLPLVLVNAGDDQINTRVPSTVVQAPTGASVGDLRLGLRVQLLGERHGPAELAVGSYFWFPTGDPSEYTGDDSVRAMPHLTLSGKLSSFVYGAQGGITIRKETELANVGVGTEFNWGLAAGILLVDDKLQIGPELYGSTVVSGTTNPGTADESNVEAFAGRTTNAELLGSVR